MPPLLLCLQPQTNLSFSREEHFAALTIQLAWRQVRTKNLLFAVHDRLVTFSALITSALPGSIATGGTWKSIDKTGIAVHGNDTNQQG